MQDPRRVLVVATAQIGDALLCTPLLSTAQARWPQARIDVLGFAGTLALLNGNPDVHRLIEVDRSAGLRGQLRQALRLFRHYDLALVTRTSDRAHLYGLVMARRRSALVPDSGQGRRWKRLVAQHAFALSPRRHQVLEKLQLLEPWVDAVAVLSLRPPAPAALPAEFEHRLADPVVVVQVPSMWRYKRWPATHFRGLVEALGAEGVQVVLTGSASADDRAQVDAVLRGDRLPGVLDAVGALSLAQLHTLLQRARAYVGPDTSVTHLAAAVGTPVVAVYGPTDPQDFGPWPANHPATQPWLVRAERQQVRSIVVLQGPDLPGRTCVPCSRMGCEHHRDSASHCLDGLEPQRVLREVLALLAAGALPAGSHQDAAPREDQRV